ncbi:hypothetical protein JZ785_16330 [Alicyclobacillus curvatus]|jgi:hypothetical protein|nr:hypothetical protein JZ785_16330 [Alicyclobacillus curvatus]
MTIILFSLLFLTVFFVTRSHRYLERYYDTVLYISLISVVYGLICIDFAMWHFPVWWIFTDHASLLFQAVVLFPSTTVVFLRYFPRSRGLIAPYFLLFVIAYVVMEWMMLKLGQIRYAHGWSLGWSTLVVVLMFLMMWLHEKSKKLTWVFTFIVITWLVTWFDVPLLAL